MRTTARASAQMARASTFRRCTATRDEISQTLSSGIEGLFRSAKVTLLRGPRPPTPARAREHPGGGGGGATAAHTPPPPPLFRPARPFPAWSLP